MELLSMHDLAVTLSGRLVTTLPPERQHANLKEIVAFGLEVGLGALWELIVLLAVAAWLGVLPEVAMAALATGSLRLCAGGAHCTAYYRCLLSSVATLCSLGWLATFLAGHTVPFVVLGAFFLTATAGFYTVYRWAPAATPGAPIGPARRPKLRRFSFLCLGFWLGLSLLIYFSSREGSLFWGVILALLLQGYTISPSGYRFILTLDKTLKILLPLEKNKQRGEAEKC